MTVFVVHNHVHPPRRRARALDARWSTRLDMDSWCALLDGERVRGGGPFPTRSEAEQAARRHDREWRAADHATERDSRDASWGDRWYVKFSATEEQEQRVAATLSRIGGRKSGYSLKSSGVNEYVYELQESGLAVTSLRNSVRAAGGKIIAEGDYM